MTDTTSPLARLHQTVRRTAELTRDRAATGRGAEAADDLEGTFATDGALGFDPFPFLRALHAAGSRAVLVGQVAGILHGSAEPTGDLDLLWDGSPDEARALRKALSATGCTDLPDLTHPQAAYRVTGATGDLCTPALPWGGLDTSGCLDRALTTTDPGDGLAVRYVTADDLIRMRRAIGRPKDHRRADELERLRAALD
ncbi:hypothetical protein ACIA8O_14450 [Kitasatospora sp. NPDC051853]|uniref:hypothetical protein n=1 Tax=Kitasatospora sp. NPDC051853 TaxID=3364058 RepID=UPI003793690F